MKKEELIQPFEYWKQHPVEFAEEVFGIKITPIQKKMLEAMTDEKVYATYPLRAGRCYVRNLMTLTEYLLQGGDKDEYL
jgi:hypothetical protein